MELRNHPFFEDLTEVQIGPLLEVAREESWTDGDVIFEEGATARSIYLVLEGEVAFKKKLPSGDQLTVSFSYPGDYFGEIGVFTREKRALAAVAKGDCKLASIAAGSVRQFFHALPGPVSSIMQGVIQHLEDTTRHYVEEMLHQEKMAVVGHMMNTVIHDFKNPFCLISLSAQLLRQRHPDDDTGRLCRNIEEQVDRMVAMASELAEFSRGEQTLNPTTLDLKELLDEFQSLNFPFFEANHYKITVDVPNLSFRGERAKLLRVLQNLVGNAIEALEDAEAGLIAISGEKVPCEDALELQVRDNGGGIPADIREKFFEPFVTHGKSHGTGLGTAIVKSIVDAHGGSIHFRTAEGEGTVFHIKLPLN